MEDRLSFPLLQIQVSERGRKQQGLTPSDGWSCRAEGRTLPGSRRTRTQAGSCVDGFRRRNGGALRTLAARTGGARAGGRGRAGKNSRERGEKPDGNSHFRACPEPTRIGLWRGFGVRPQNGLLLGPCWTCVFFASAPIFTYWGSSRGLAGVALRSSLLITHLGRCCLLALHATRSHANFFDASFLWCHSKSIGQGVGNWLPREMSSGGDWSTAE